MTLSEALSPSDAVIYQGRTLHINTWARKFLFTTEQLKQPVRAMSGGEQARIHIARLMLQPADVLVLDEPTNDLDIPSLEVLEESLEEFPGSIVLVTHDRAMLARLATTIVALDGLGGARHFASFEQWVRAQREPAAKAASMPSATIATGAAVAPAAEPVKAKRKLTYKEQRELAEIEPSIHKNEALVKEYEAKLNDPAITADHKAFDKVCREMAAAQTQVTRLYERWAELDG